MTKRTRKKKTKEKEEKDCNQLAKGILDLVTSEERKTYKTTIKVIPKSRKKSKK